MLKNLKNIRILLISGFNLGLIYSIGFILNFYIGHYYSPNTYFDYTYYIAIFGFIKILLDFGTNSEIFTIKNKKFTAYINDILNLKIIIFFSSLLIICFSFFMWNFNIKYLTIGVFVFLNSFIDLALYRYRYLEKNNKIFTLSSTYLSFSIIVLIINAFYATELFLLLFQLIIVKIVIIVFSLNFSFIQFQLNFKRIVSSFPFLFFTMISYAFNSIDILFTKTFLTETYLPNYVFSLKAVAMTAIILDVLNFTYFKILENKNLIKISILYFFFGIFAVVFYLLLIPFIYDFGYSEYYLNNTQNLTIALIIPLNFLLGIFSFWLLKRGFKIFLNKLLVFCLILVLIVSQFKPDIGIWYLYVHRIILLIIILTKIYFEFKRNTKF